MFKNKPNLQCDFSKISTWGLNISEKYQCIHYHTPLDVVAIRLKCCHIYYACIRCHTYHADHLPIRWTWEEFDEKAVICGCCKTLLSIYSYLMSPSDCPICKAVLNPGCKSHHHFYFEPWDTK
ncbi:MAG: hypothetical protein H7A38_00110 [Chlamydiales bacterium]|nr:hypothetical protein [Chlamydiales bacterium]